MRPWRMWSTASSTGNMNSGDMWMLFILPGAIGIMIILGLIVFVACEIEGYINRLQPKKCPKCGACRKSIHAWIYSSSAFWGSYKWGWVCDNCNHKWEPIITQGYHPIYRRTK